MRDLYLDDFNPGDRFTSPGLSLTEAQIIGFATQWDPVDFHMDVEVGSRHELGNGGIFASGFHTLCITMRLFRQTGILDKCNIAGAGMDNLRWRAPVRPDDTLYSVAEIIATRPSKSKPDRGTVTITHSAVNQHHETVFSADCIHMVRRRPTP